MECYNNFIFNKRNISGRHLERFNGTLARGSWAERVVVPWRGKTVCPCVQRVHQNPKRNHFDKWSCVETDIVGKYPERLTGEDLQALVNRISDWPFSSCLASWSKCH